MASVSGRFIEVGGGAIATVAWTPPPDVAVRFRVLHVPAAFEEMNKSRRLVAEQARALADIGGHVVVYDPWGTGDSTGDHADATWARWRDDALFVWNSVCAASTVPTLLWGLRLGALMAASLVAEGVIEPTALVLWQPVASGRSYFNQFLRLVTAAGLAGRETVAGDSRRVRQSLDAGMTVEVAGYALNPSLVEGSAGISLESFEPPRCPVIWREISPTSPARPSDVTARISSKWQGSNPRVDVRAVTAASFWASLEIEPAPALVAATTAAVDDVVRQHAALAA